MKDFNNAYRFLKVVINLVRIYGACMVVFGRSFAMPLFDALRFGPTAVFEEFATNGQDASIFLDYALFCFGVLGAVIVGWTTLMLHILGSFGGPDESDPKLRSQTRRILAFSTTIWFAFDTGFSLIIGQYEHAAFNLPFFGLLMGSLWAMHREDEVDRNGFLSVK